MADNLTSDRSRPANVPTFGDAASSELHNERTSPGVGGAPDSAATPEAKRAGYGYSYVGESSPSMGGHNIDQKNQYTVKLPRGSSL